MLQVVRRCRDGADETRTGWLAGAVCGLRLPGCFASFVDMRSSCSVVDAYVPAGRMETRRLGGCRDFSSLDDGIVELVEHDEGGLRVGQRWKKGIHRRRVSEHEPRAKRQ